MTTNYLSTSVEASRLRSAPAPALLEWPRSAPSISISYSVFEVVVPYPHYLPVGEFGCFLPSISSILLSVFPDGENKYKIYAKPSAAPGDVLSEFEKCLLPF